MDIKTMKMPILEKARFRIGTTSISVVARAREKGKALVQAARMKR